MTVTDTAPDWPPLLDAGGGLTALVHPNGALAWLTAGELRVNLHPGTALEPGPANLWLRIRDGGSISAHPLLGPASGSTVLVADEAVTYAGTIGEVEYRAVLALSDRAASWSWTVEVTQTGERAVELDLVAAQDVALAGAGEVRSNELYVSQYVDVTPLDDADHGFVLGVRQNQPKQGSFPWLLFGCSGRAVAYATDSLQVYGTAARTGDAPAGLAADLPSVRVQHEHTLATLQSEAITLEAGESVRTGFFGYVLPHHPDATSDTDLARVAEAIGSLPATAGALSPHGDDAYAESHERHATPEALSGTLFSPVRPVRADDLGEHDVADLFGDELEHAERDADGHLLSFFVGGRHVVLRRKELAVLRPHGHLLRTGAHLYPDASSLTATGWMTGSPLSYVTQGHVSINRLLSTNRGYLGLQRAYGIRLFVELEDRWRLLDLPSAFEMERGRARWWYRGDFGLICVQTTAPTHDHRISLDVLVHEGLARRFLAAVHVGTDGDDGLEPGPVSARTEVGTCATQVVVGVEPGSFLAERYPDGSFTITIDGGARDARVDDDGPLFLDGRSRGLRYLTVITEPLTAGALTITADLLPDASPTADADLVRDEVGDPAAFWDELSSGLRLGGTGDDAVRRLDSSLDWMVRDALVHYLSPRGLEQYTGGGWGTRDISQGPVELLLALERTDALRELLLLILAAQSPDGDWPQSFGFFAEDAHFRHAPPHGDVIFWPVLAVGRYLETTGDASLLDEAVPYFSSDGAAETTTVAEHLDRALTLAAELVLPGTHLAAYGHGDWNDSLQPADPTMAETMTSTWTVTLHHQALETLATGLAAAGRPDTVAALREQAATIATELQDQLVVDDVLTGYARFADGQRSDLLVHPRDVESGLTYSVLPMIHAVIDGLLTPEQAAAHLGLIEEHLLGPDGVRLFDRPPTYRGGPMRYFQRAESATFVGREIGIMYTHAHLRYAEALARVGRPDQLWHALQQVVNIGVEVVIANARPRQANTYASSSDAWVRDRDDFAERYPQVMSGEVEVEGGWRIYSSGAGIFVRLVRQCLFGLRRRGNRLELDPVLPAAFDGTETTWTVGGRTLTVRFLVGSRGYGPARLTVDGTEVPSERLSNPYREGGLSVAAADLPDGSVVGVHLG